MLDFGDIFISFLFQFIEKLLHVMQHNQLGKKTNLEFVCLFFNFVNSVRLPFVPITKKHKILCNIFEKLFITEIAQNGGMTPSFLVYFSV